MTALLDAPLTTNPRLQIQGELFAADCFRRPPSMPQFRDEPEMPKEPLKPKPEKSIPWWHPQQPYNSFLLEMLFKREERSMPRDYEGSVSEERRAKFKREA